MDLAWCLAASPVIDRDHPSVGRLATSISQEDELATIQATYELVRDRFAHSYDICAAEVSRSASDVIRHGHGICFAKAHLLAALLRPNSIPAGVCYQRLAPDDPRDPRASYLHGLNAMWFDGRWRRLDARGNKIVMLFTMVPISLLALLRLAAPKEHECTVTLQYHAK